ncbi:hypothetical protein K1T71_009873 [Dendrolimus kikuchii]|uniref:Uncharacterized protein n=1 Tax=Dendrolimus kikuchii TaxID=765133 RepID=A0ACC1CT27_9NEOP|nr:hypothetical protein K1T71_009873 [Dendrolimus kikuchii]
MASFRMIWMFLFAAAALNLANYTFYYYFDPPSYRKRIMPLLGKSKDGYLAEHNIDNEGMKTTFSSKPTDKEISWCPKTPPNLGPISEDISLRNYEKLGKMYWDVLPGGIYKPPECKARYSAAIIVPYRGNNRTSLNYFLYLIHQFLMKQQLEYQIFVIEQGDTKPFNHGKLINAGFTEIYRRKDNKDKFKCVILHEPYLVPMDTRNLYRCSHRPRQLAVNVEKPDNSAYEPLFGGAIAIRADQYIRVNGFSNKYWGNDADLEDMFLRLKYSNFSVERSFTFIGTYATLKIYDVPAIEKSNLEQTTPPMNMLDGLTSMSYSVIEYGMETHHTYLNVSIDVDEENGAGASISEILFWNKFNKPDKREQTHIPISCSK